ncbi:acyl-ACP desaturase [Hwanghaeella sp.]|uniref:acyl-ACP desaturase n=1 Tax=Hwanghaeella sp. TaxID=2605943 RepID=UPI003CCBA8FC
MPAHWSLDDIDWDRFDPSKVDPELLKLVKAASLVEHNGGEYTDFLCKVFDGDQAFLTEVRRWGVEEVQHGKALAKWATLADPSFDFDSAFKRFVEGYRPFEEGATSSKRGSRTGELVARCIVETGTSSYYTAISKQAEEPVLAQICKKIAADEFRHYKLFYDHMRRYQKLEGLGRFGRFRVALGRLGETEDDELAYAFYVANTDPATAYDRVRDARNYTSRAFRQYGKEHVMKAAAMMLKAIGVPSNGHLAKAIGNMGWMFLRRRAQTG